MLSLVYVSAGSTASTPLLQLGPIAVANGTATVSVKSVKRGRLLRTPKTARTGTRRSATVVVRLPKQAAHR